MTARFAASIAVLAVVAGLIAGCGGSDSTTTVTAGATETSTSTTGDAERVVIQAEDGAFDARAIYESAVPGVVTVISVFDNAGGGGILGGGGPSGGQGSGFVISDEGEILTNAHVVTDAETTGTPTRPLHEADEIYIQFPDRNQVSADVVGFDPFADVALLKVDPDGLDLNPLNLGSEADVQVGDAVAAIGSPFGQNQSLSVGVVSATDRDIESLTDFRIEGALQTDASINPGNSGGPLLDANARVIGINEQIRTRSGSNAGVGFAVPVSAVKRSIAQLRENGEVKYAHIGVSSQALYPQLAEHLGIDTKFGSLLSDVVPGGPADDAGLQGGDKRIRFQAGSYKVGGDVIVAVNGRKVIRPDDLARLISALSPGDEVKLDVIHDDGEREEVQVTLGVRPDTVPTG